MGLMPRSKKLGTRKNNVLHLYSAFHNLEALQTQNKQYITKGQPIDAKFTC